MFTTTIYKRLVLLDSSSIFNYKSKWETKSCARENEIECIKTKKIFSLSRWEKEMREFECVLMKLQAWYFTEATKAITSMPFDHCLSALEILQKKFSHFPHRVPFTKEKMPWCPKHTGLKLRDVFADIGQENLKKKKWLASKIT